MTTSSNPWWSQDTVAVVRGANKGIGYEMVRSLADHGLTVVSTARDPVKGKAALDALKTAGQNSVNNAAIAAGSASLESYENAKEIIDNNYYGTKNVTKRLLPLLRPPPAGAIYVNTISRAGFSSRLRTETLRQKFRKEDTYSEEVADSLATKYIEDIKAGRWDEEGWVVGGADNAPIYSKIFLIVYMKALAKSLSISKPEGHTVLVTCFCPGAVKTDMMSALVAAGLRISPAFPLKTPVEGADTGLLPEEEVTQKNGIFSLRERSSLSAW